MVASTGTALTEMRTGTCTIPATAVAAGATVKTTCTIVGGTQNLQAYTVSLIPSSGTPANNLLWSVDQPSTTAIIIRWASVAGTPNTGALTFRWFAVR